MRGSKIPNGYLSILDIKMWYKGTKFQGCRKTGKWFGKKTICSSNGKKREILQVRLCKYSTLLAYVICPTELLLFLFFIENLSLTCLLTKITKLM